jgi:class 3 adenylate cyclase
MTTTTEPETSIQPEPAPKPRSLRRRVLSRISIQSKLLVMLLVTSILSAAVVGFIGYQSGRSSLRASVFDRLTEVRASQSRQLEAQFAELKNSLIIYTRGSTTTEAIEAFTPAFDQLDNTTITPAQWQSIVDYYNNQFEKAEENQTGDHLDVDALLPTSNAQKYLQAYYTAPFNDWNKAIQNDDARDGSAWSVWLASPVGPQNRVEGVLVLQFPISKINRLMTADKQWAAAGMGRTGETFVVGPDDLMRSDSRLFLENAEEFKRDVVNAGTPPDVADESIRQGGTTLVQPVASEATRQAQRGQTGTIIESDYLGHETLQSYAPVSLPGLHWSVIAKIDTAEAFAPVAAFTRTLVLSTAVIIFVVCIAAMLLARLFVRPIRRLEAGAQQISSGDYHVTLPVRSRDEFGDLTVAFNDMSRNLAIKEELLAEQRRENDRLLLSLMPEPVVQRYREGEETIAQDHQNVTVIFADIAGLDELARELSSDELLAIVNKLTRQFDAAAENLGVEQVRTLHNGYLASCGLSVPRLDNVRRTVDFAVEMQHIVNRFNGETGHDLRLRAGIDTGTVTSGLVGRSTLAYDMWGSAVNLANQVQSGSPQPGVHVTSAVYEAMRDSRHFTSVGVITVDGEEQPIWRLAERQP